MEIPEHPAITVLCATIDRLPREARRTAIGFLCNALGQRAERTGIAFSPDREIRHLYWDNETKELYGRLVYLVETAGLWEQLAVQGAVSYIETHFAQWADRDFAERCVQGFHHTLAQMQNQLRLPVEKRDRQQSDDEIHDFIQKLEQLVESAETRRQEAEDTWQQLRSAFDTHFTLEFWEALNALQIDRSHQRIDELLNRDEGDEQQSRD